MTMPKGWERPSSSYPDQPSYSDDYSYSIEDRSKPANIQENALALSGGLLTFNPEGSQIFISYAREDERAALRLYDDLKDAGLDPWIDKKKLLPGQDPEREIQYALENSSYFIPLLSSDSISTDKFVAIMLFSIRNLDKVSEGLISVIPVRLDDCEVPYEELRLLHILDLFPHEKNWREGVEMIVQAINQDAENRNTVIQSVTMTLDLIKAEKYDDASEKYDDASEKYDEAIEYLDKALTITPNEPIVLACKGLALFFRMVTNRVSNPEKCDEAIEYLDKALTITPDNQDILYFKEQILEIKDSLLKKKSRRT